MKVNFEKIEDLSKNELKVYLFLLDEAEKMKTQMVYAYPPYVAQIIKCSKRTVERALNKLRELGYIEKTLMPFVFTVVADGDTDSKKKSKKIALPDMPDNFI